MKFIISSLMKCLNVFSFLTQMKWPYQVIVFLTLFLQPIAIPIGLLIILLLADMNTSIYAQYKTTKRRTKKLCPTGCFRLIWKTIKPDRIMDTVDKIIGYNIALAVCLALDTFVYRVIHVDRLELVSLTNAAFTIITTREAVSILKNLSRITNNEVFDKLANLVTRKQRINEQEIAPETVSDN